MAKPLPPRYEIRILEPKHTDWAKAIVIHSNVFHSPIWPVLYPENTTQRAYNAFKAADYLIRHQVMSGLSLGVFDTEYVYKNQDSVATEGKLYWNFEDQSPDGQRLVELMDFPLVSVALSYDSLNALDMTRMVDLVACLPAFGSIHNILNARDRRQQTTWEAERPGEVLFRNATSTRHDYEKKGIMAHLARYLMSNAALQGWRGIQIDCMADAVAHVWMNPPTPFRAELVSEVDLWAHEEKTDGEEIVFPFRPSVQKVRRVYCSLS
ncbi:hypothetical protein BGZ63DRAFT_414284 [Mariannaea sp. PMI_226]|nr:hypothetical protein BGZ63DRAFT_414284 [Mariannaea sp. PMI_226]